MEMKRKIQAKIYAEIKDMTAEERIFYFRIPPEQAPFRLYNIYLGSICQFCNSVNNAG